MRFVYLAAVLTTVCSLELNDYLGDPWQKSFDLRKFKRFPVHGGLPNGAIITFYFDHIGGRMGSSTKKNTYINFYNELDVPMEDENKHNVDHPASFELREKGDKYITFAYYKDNRYHNTDGDRETPDNPPAEAWWRFDVIKLDRFTVSAYFLGYPVGIHEFPSSLDNIKSIYMFSNSGRMNIQDLSRYTQIRLKMPNANIVPLSRWEVDSFYQNSGKALQLITFPAFPVGTHIEMTALLQGDKPDNEWEGLRFGTKDNHFLTIHQTWNSTTIDITLTSGTNDILCSKVNNATSGPLQHLYLRRTDHYGLTLDVIHSHSCYISIDSNLLILMARRFGIWSKGSEIGRPLIFHLDHSLPRFKAN